MPIYTDVVASRIEKYRAQLEREGGNDADIDAAILKYVVCQLVDAAFSGGGGGGGGDASAANQVTGNTALAAIRDRTPVLGAATIAQSQPVSIALDQWVPIDTQRINGVTTSVGVGAADAGTQRVAIGGDTRIVGYGYESKVTLTRPANTTPYLVNSVWGGMFELANFGASGGHVILSGVRVIFSNTTLPSGMAGFTLFLYSGTPPSAVTDGGFFSVPSTDRATLLTPGGIDLGSAVAAIGGGSVVLQANNLNIQLKLATGVSSVWGYLVNRSAHTPVSGSTAAIAALMLGV